jgi:fructuronate reductase
MRNPTDAGNQGLCLATLAQVSPSVRRPRVDPTQLKIGIVHLGVGAFHRAHQAVYTEDAIALDGGDWGILGVSLRRPDAANALVPQDCLYTVETLGQSTSYRLIGTLRSVVTASEQPDAVFAVIAANNVHVITLTVTEKGYSFTDEGGLDTGDPDILEDLRGTALPKSTLGWLMRGLMRRYRDGGRPLTILSCDNISRNSEKLRRALLQFAGEVDLNVAAWIRDEVGFPNTVVDCVVPATDAPARLRVQSALGLIDAAPVQREEFSQWVIEDSFAGPRPVWEAAGVQVVSDVADYEKLKLHVLNATHSAMAYLGPRRGHVYVRQAVADVELSQFLDDMVANEISSALTPLPVTAYWSQTKCRFANPKINHALAQIAEDGSKKLAVRIFPLLIANARAGRPTRCFARVIRAWLEFARQPVKDPLRDRLARWSSAGGALSAALDDPVLFPDPFRTEPRVRAAVEHLQ